jgi:ribosomal protein S18 acetylase RimI-like enzyme
MEIHYSFELEGVDWEALKIRLRDDAFDNGRTPEQLRRSFENSRVFGFAWADGQVVGKARILSDGVCNAYLVDVWTYSPFRRRGIASELLRRMLERVPGQHVYLQADEDHIAFYTRLGFRPQPNGLSRVVGRWLDPTS